MLYPYKLIGRSNMKIRKSIKNNLPRGIYKYLIIINLSSYEFRSKTYNIAKSKYRLIKYKSKREEQKIRNLTKRHNKVWNLDKLISNVEEYAVGKIKIDFKVNRNRPLYFYLTDKNDFTILLMNYQNIIFRIYEFSTKSKLE